MWKPMKPAAPVTSVVMPVSASPERSAKCAIRRQECSLTSAVPFLLGFGQRVVNYRGLRSLEVFMRDEEASLCR